MAREFRIAKEIALDATPEEVWESISTEAGLATWSTFPAVGPDSDMVVAWEPPRRLVTRTPEAADGSVHAFEYLIETRGGGRTVLRFVHSGFAGDDWSHEYEPTTSGGWDMYLQTLAQYHAHFSGRRGAVVVAEGPPASTVAEAWAVLLAALGTKGELGSRAGVELAGIGTLEGDVDYASPNFLGVLTPSALVRFHGRWPLGMSIAVSHHDFADSFDSEAAGRAWKEWLDRTLSAVKASA